MSIRYFVFGRYQLLCMWTD